MSVTDPSLGGLLVALILLIVLSAFFSGSETALLTINRYRLRALAEQGHRGARLARKLLERPDRLISLILLCNNFANIMASSLATIIALHLGGEGAIGIAAGLLTLILLLFAEVSPKTYATLHPERLALGAAYIYVFLFKLLSPIVWLVNLFANGLLRLIGVAPEHPTKTVLNSEELRTIVSETGAMLPERSRSMLLAILDLERATVADIMIPRHEVEGINLQDSAEEIIQTIRNTSYTRLPLFDGELDHIIGIVHARNALHILLEHEFNKEHLRTIASEPYFVPFKTPLYQQLLHFQREKHQIGLVIDEYGEVLGLITLTDLLEEIVGEFTTNPADSLAEIYYSKDGSLLIDCSINIRHLNRALQWNLPINGPKTLNGLILDYLETIPESGTSLTLYGHPLSILQTTENGIKTIKVIQR